MLDEVAPPGWGHTKAEKEKTKPDKPKSKIGGSAAAFKRALDDGRFKGLPGDKTKKEKTASMFKLMWSMKKKGDKPHYKPGSDKKYKKYQEEETSMPNVSSKDRGAIKKRAKNLFKKDLTGEHEGVNEGKCDDCTCKGCGPDGVGHENPCVECGGHHKEKVNEKYGDTFDTVKYKRKHSDTDKKHKESDLRMKHGKRWSDYSDAVVAAKKKEKNRLKPGEFKKLVDGKWVSNK